MNRDDLIKLLQNTYFDNIDNADPESAIKAFNENIVWEHNQVWEHDGHKSQQTDQIEGRDSVLAFLKKRIGEMQTIKIKHKLTQAIVNGDLGAFRGYVVGPDGTRRPFSGWVNLENGRITRYTVFPEKFGAA